ncbi:MAG: hydroxymethylbilane synthase [Gammaproteobacteria bacterium]|nr:hydroxymethylbilane synthase [Gammaproteobacteria bacterium]
MPDLKLNIITRKSPLAMWQAQHVCQNLETIYPDLTVNIAGITTEADKFLDRSLDKFGGKGAFTKELELALLDGTADLAVHSMKDVTVDLPDGLEICAILTRQDPGDAFLSNSYKHIDELPSGSSIGTSSLRRISQLLAYRPDLKIKAIRGNVGTRLKKLDNGEFDALILASSGLKRMGLNDRITHEINMAIMLPAIGQGALGLEVRSSNSDHINLLQVLNDETTFKCVMAERRVNKKLNGGCHAPIAAYASVSGSTMTISAKVGSLDGSQIIDSIVSGPVESALELGDTAGDKLVSQGALEILSTNI